MAPYEFDKSSKVPYLPTLSSTTSLLLELSRLVDTRTKEELLPHDPNSTALRPKILPSIEKI